MPQWDLGLQVCSRHSPTGPVSFIEITIVAKLHDKIDAHTFIAIIVIVRLPHVSVRVNSHFIGVSEIMSKHFNLSTLNVSPEDHPFPVGFAIVNDLFTRNIPDNFAFFIS